MSRPGPEATPGTFSAGTPGATTPRRRVSFRLPVWALLLPMLAVLCFLPLATAGGGFTWLAYGVPVLVLAATLLTRTTADARQLVVTGPWRRHTIAWADLDRLEFTGTRWAVAVTGSGKRVRLVMVRPRDLPALTAVAGGELLLADNPESGPDVAGPAGGAPGTDSAETAQTAGPVDPADPADVGGPAEASGRTEQPTDGVSSAVQADPVDGSVDGRPAAPPHPAGERTVRP